jgi:hypothetical protein
MLFPLIIRIKAFFLEPFRCFLNSCALTNSKLYLLVNLTLYVELDKIIRNAVIKMSASAHFIITMINNYMCSTVAYMYM